jgi:hypothetical protein
VNIAASSHVAGVRRTWNRRTPALQAFARAWNNLSWRHWLIAVGIGVLMGVFNAVFLFLYMFKNVIASNPRMLAAWPEILAVLLTHYVLLLMGVACALAFALALLRDLSRRAAIRPRDVALTIVAVAAFGSLVVDTIAVAATGAVHTWLHVPTPMFTAGVDWLTALSRMYSNSGEKVLTFVATVTLSGVYYFKDSRTSDALAIVQLGLSQAQKRRLTEELRSAQAALDPDFLFATLADIDRRFDSDPRVAQRLLDTLIRYLRAALPANDDAIGTLGQQATLVRAYLEIESIRSAGRMQAIIDVPSELEARPFAPALILPLVALAAGSADGSGQDTQILVKASLANGRLTVEVRGNGREPGVPDEQEMTLASLRHRLGVLYGSRAELSFATRAPRGSTARIVIDDPGIP